MMKKMKNLIKNTRNHLIAILVFFLLAFAYFSPAVFQGKTLRQGDIIHFKGAAQELAEYAKTEESKEYDVLAWMGNMFSGMPSYTVTIQKLPTNFINYLENPIKSLYFEGAGIVLAALICFYILMSVLGVNFWLAMMGSIAFAFSSYNIIILEAGHITKAYVIAYMPLTVAGMLLVFREKWMLGAALTFLGITLSFKNNHAQISYYLALFCVFLFLSYLLPKIKEKNFTAIWKTTACFLIALFIALLPNLSMLYGNYESSKESIRGKSELTALDKTDGQKKSGGLDIDYAFAWSYGKAETMTLLIPNFYGGASGGELDSNSELYKAMKSKGMKVGKKLQTVTYWGSQPFTSGPVYFGALICFLFVFGMFMIKNQAKWWILAATIFFIFLSWGKNFLFFNEFLFHYLPFYNKFRAPSMALVIPSLTFPLIAVWGLKELFTKEKDNKKVQKALLYSFGIVGGLCLIFCLIPTVFLDFQSANDAQYGFPDWYYDALLKDRASLLKADAFRSFVFISLGAAAIFWFIKSKTPKTTLLYVAASICLLVFVDLYFVDSRYINHDSFVAKKVVAEFKKTPADNFILQDTDPSYRVLNLNNPFQEARTSYYHKSIGGYSAAKLGRYQDLIDHMLGAEINTLISSLQKIKTEEDLLRLDVFSKTPILNMLNTRYVVFNQTQNPIVNRDAYGNAWFVDDVRIVEGADEEMAGLKEIAPQKTILVDRKFSPAIENFHPRFDETASIELVSYEPVKLVYKSSAATEQMAVFSEVYYPHGWQAYIDGKPVEHFRANWILRAMAVPAGERIIEFKFVPKTYISLSKLASISSLLILLALVFILLWSAKEKIKKESSSL